jgi:predicted GH43/DUF377 family glycosyl hydrolase
MDRRLKHELFRRHLDNPILSVNDWPYDANSVFNAAAAYIDHEVVLLVRVEDFRGFSHFTVARSKDGVHNWKIDPKPTFISNSSFPEEIWGIEDPRITWVPELQSWAITYTAFSRGGPLVSLATTKDFKTFTRFGPVMTPEDKDAAIFPVRFENRWAMLHRPVAKTGGSISADIWLSFSPDLKHWGDHQQLIHAREGSWWDANKIGLSAPPLETSEGWLILYHGVRSTASGSIYRLGLALLDLNDPRKVIRRSDEWVFGPKASYEREGDVDDVVFSCGWIEKDGIVDMYYGAADSCIALASANLKDLVDYICKCSKPN